MRLDFRIGLLLLLLLAGCTAGGGKARLDYPRDQAILQLSYGGGLTAPSRTSEAMPDVTIWGNGRVVFAAPDGTVREGRLESEGVDRLMIAASFLYELQSDYAAVAHTDAPMAIFTVHTDRGSKGVSVYGLDPIRQQENEPEPQVFARLRGLWAEVQKALPADAPEMKPTVVFVQTWYSEEEATTEWPPELKGRLTGTEAQRSISLGGLGEARTFRVGDRAQHVLVVPELPRPGDRERP